MGESGCGEWSERKANNDMRWRGKKVLNGENVSIHWEMRSENPETVEVVLREKNDTKS